MQLVILKGNRVKQRLRKQKERTTTGLDLKRENDG